jgi:hypothetical protein
MDMRFGIWNIKNLYRAGSLITVAKEISKYRAFNQGGNREESVEPEQHFSGIAALTADSRMSH